jgi:hypothetical protein
MEHSFVEWVGVIAGVAAVIALYFAWRADGYLRELRQIAKRLAYLAMSTARRSRQAETKLAENVIELEASQAPQLCPTIPATSEANQKVAE